MQVQSDKERIQLLQDYCADLQKQHAEVVAAHKLEIEKLHKQLSEYQS